MKPIISFGLGALIATLVVMFALPSHKKFQAELDRLHAQNDSLYSAIDSTTAKIKQLDSMACVLGSMVNEDKKKLGNLNKKANEYKEKYNKEHNRIIAMSNADAALEFSNSFK
jgi:uncharacterized coiled-coil DUF342 family protein